MNSLDLTNIVNHNKKIGLVKAWAIRAIIAYALAFVIDTMILHNENLLDQWLTQATAEFSGKLARLVNPSNISVNSATGGWSVYENGTPRVFIGHACNARNIYFLYIGFLLTMPLGTYKRKLKYLFVGLGLIYLFNVVRVFLLFLIAANMPGFFEFTHKYLFQISIYILLFILWHNYLKKYTQNEN